MADRLCQESYASCPLAKGENTGSTLPVTLCMFLADFSCLIWEVRQQYRQMWLCLFIPPTAKYTSVRPHACYYGLAIG